MWTNWESSDFVTRHKTIDKCIHFDPAIRDIHRLYEILNSKSAALFSYVSIMTAVCTFLLGSLPDVSDFERYIILTAIFLYMVISVVMLKILDFNMYDLPISRAESEEIIKYRNEDPYDNGTDKAFERPREFFAQHVRTRGIAHREALKWTQRLTVAVMACGIGDILIRGVHSFAPLTEQWLKAFAESLFNKL